MPPFTKLGFGGSAEGVNVLFTDSSTDTVDRTIYTFSAQALGTPASDRRIVVMVNGSVTGPPVVSSATIGGIATTNVLEVSDGASTGTILIASVPTGTTGDVVITWDIQAARCAISVYRMTGASSATPSATANDTTLTGDVLSTTLTIPPSGAAIGNTKGGGGVSVTWAGLTENNDFVMDTANISSASRNSPSGDTNLAVSTTFSTTPSGGTVLVAASWAV
ncbi:MAG: hypothetical protein V3S55_06440 [Nitrospiraceae bacterium]